MPIVADSPSTEPVAARFDWYAATILEYPQRLLEVLSSRLHGHIVDGTPRNGYASAATIRSGDRVLATVYYGGSFEWPHAFASSDETDSFVEVVRDVWPDAHRVTRMDCALDFDNGDGTFPDLLAICSKLADGDVVDGKLVQEIGDERRRRSKVRVRNVGDWHRGVDGRTFYLGSPKSAVQTRLYEKGILIRLEAAKFGQERPDISLNLVRLEVQVRPDGPAKVRAASASPLEAWGYADWTRELLRRVDGADVERVHIRERRDSEHERAMQWVAQQYRKHFIHAAERNGGWAGLGLELGKRIMEGFNAEAPAGPPWEGPMPEAWTSSSSKTTPVDGQLEDEDDSRPF